LDLIAARLCGAQVLANTVPKGISRKYAATAMKKAQSRNDEVQPFDARAARSRVASQNVDSLTVPS
jgi:hypothetical protein